jgi:hypothetical protein
MKTKFGLLLVMLSLAVWCDDSTDAEQPTDPKVDYKQPPSENQPENTVTDWTNRRLNRAVAAATKAQQRSDARSQWLLDNPKNPDPYKQRPATGEPEPAPEPRPAPTVLSNHRIITDFAVPSGLVQHNGELYVVGSRGGKSISISKFNADLETIWEFDHAVGGRYGTGLSSASVSPDGFVNVSGILGNTTTLDGIALGHGHENDPFVGQIDSEGNWVWAEGIETPAWSGTSDVLTVDNGDIYFTGYIYGSAQFGSTTLTSNGWYDAFIAKTDKDGNWLWAKSAGGSSGDAGRRLSVDSEGNIYWSGDFRNTVTFGETTLTFRGGGSVDGGGDIFLCKLSPDGEFLWTKSMGSNGTDGLRNMAVNSSDEIILTASVTGEAEFGQLHTAGNRVMSKLTKDGEFLWTKDIPQGGGFEFKGISVGEAGNISILATHSGERVIDGKIIKSHGDTDIAYLVFDTNSTLVAVYSWGGTGSCDIHDFVSTEDGSLYVLATFTDSMEILGEQINGQDGKNTVLLDLDVMKEPEPKSAQATVNSLPRSLQRGLVAYYPFNGNAKDESGNGHDGKVKGAVLAQESKKATHAGYLFVEGHIDLPNALAQQFEGNSPISVSMWVRSSPNLTEGNRSMFAIGVEAHNRAFVMVMAKGRFLYSQWVDGDVRTDYVISDRKWYHCVATYDGSSCSLYADGQLLTQKKVDANRATESIMIGKSFVGQKELWKDQIDDVRIYNRALSAAEVKAIYDFEKP